MRTACWAVGIWASGSAGAQRPPAAPVQAAGRPVAEWIADLKSDDVLVREEAILVLGGLGPRAKEALPALTALLKDPAPTVRTKAALAAWQIDRSVKEAVPILLETLQRGTRGQRGQVLALIGQLAEGEPDVLVALLKMAHDPDKELSAKARDAANKLGARALPALTKLAESPDGNVRKQAIVQIGRCGAAGQSAAGVLTARLKDEDWETRFLAAQALWSVERRTADVVPILVQAAEKPDVIARRTAFTILTQIKPPPREALPIFRAALKDDQPSVQLGGAEMIWQLEKNPAEVLPVLERIFDSPSGTPGAVYRAKALEIVAQMGDAAKPLRGRLVELLKSGDPALQFPLPPILGRLGPESIPALVELLTSPERKGPAPFMAAQTLGHMGKDAVDPLVKHLRHESPAVRLAVFQALDVLGPQAKAATPALKDLLKSADLGDRLRAANCLGRIGKDAKDAVPALVERIEDSDASVRRAALAALTAIGARGADVRASVDKAIKDDSSIVRVAAAELLWQIDPDNKELIATVIDLLKDRKGAGFQAGRLLIKMGPQAKQALPVLSEMLASDNNYDRTMAASAIQQLGPLAKETAPALIAALSTPEPNVRIAVIQALRSVKVKDKAVVPALSDLLGTAPPFLQTQIMQLLMEHGGDARAAIPAVRKQLASNSPPTRLLAAETLLAIDAKELTEVRPLLHEFMKSPALFFGLPAARILWQADPKDEASARFLLDKLRDPVATTREIAARAFESCGPWAKSALPALTEALDDSSVLVRVHAARAIWKIEPGNKRVVPALIDVLQQKDERSSRGLAVTGLGDVGPPAQEAIPWIRAVLRDVPVLRNVAEDALRKIDPKSALP